MTNEAHRTTARVAAVAFIVAVAALAAYSLPRLEVRTEILDFLPDAGDRQLAELSRHVAASDLNRTVTLTITGRDVDESARAARVLGDALREADEVRWVRTGPTEDLQRAFYEVYFPHRFALLGDEDTARRLFAPGALEARARELRSRLGSPAGAFVRRIATDDPWLAFLHHVEALSSSQQGELAVHDGVFVTREADQAADEDAEGASDVTTVPSGVVLFASEHSPFNAAASGRLLAQLDRALNETRETIGAELSVEQASVHRIAHASEGAIRADIQRVSIAGTLGVLLLLLVLFRSPRAIFLGGLPLALGMLLAISISQLVFGAIHGLTLAFGATLIGVAIDYVAHLLNHHYLAPSADGAAGSLRRIRVGLVLGAGTTIVGLSGLAWTSFPGIRQMAVFTCVGVAGALVATIIVLPPLLPDAPRATPVHRALAAGVDRMLVALSSRRRALVALPLLAIAIAIVGVPQLDWQDDIRALSELDAEMSEEDARVRARVARMEAGRFVVATGTNLQAALERNDDVAAALAAANEAGEVASFRSLRGLLPSAATQRASLEAIPDDAAERTFAALESEGFVREPFAPLAEALRGARDGSVLTLADLDGTPLEMLARTFVIPLDEGDDAPVAVLSYVTGVSDAAALARRVEAIEGVRFFDQAAFMSRAYRDFRTRTIELVAFGLLAVLLMVALRYRRVRPTLAAFSPALLSAAATLGVFGALGQPATLLHVVTLLLVLSMGVDYGVFMVESGEHPEGSGPTVVSLLTACGSTALSFGVLAMSAQPAMRAMGLTAAIGVGLSLALAPAAWLLVAPRRRPEVRAETDDDARER